MDQNVSTWLISYTQHVRKWNRQTWQVPVVVERFWKLVRWTSLDLPSWGRKHLLTWAALIWLTATSELLLGMVVNNLDITWSYLVKQSTSSKKAIRKRSMTSVDLGFNDAQGVSTLILWDLCSWLRMTCLWAHFDARNTIHPTWWCSGM